MPRSANRLVGHLMPQSSIKLPGTGGTTSPGGHPYHKSSVFVYRTPSVNAPAGGGTIRAKSPMNLTINTRRDSRSSSSHVPSQQKNSMLAKEDDFDAIDGFSNTSRKVSIVEGKDGEVEIFVDKDEPVIFTIFEAANIDGVQHLSSKSRCTRYTWFLLITLFVCMCFYQIATQAMMYWFTPIATNIAAIYPTSIAFPVVAICNNNQYRLTYLTGSVIQNRRAKNRTFSMPDIDDNSTNVFDQALMNTWDMDALKFLRNSAHWKARMILKCNWPNGTRCRTSDFKPLWTLTGLCWAINSDHENPAHVVGAGPGNALKLLLNIERYERIESCTPKFRTTSLPGLKILIYNQSDVPASSLEGVNVPPGFTMDIPFRMQHRQKFSGQDCVEEMLNIDGSYLSFENPQNVRTCLIRSYLSEIEIKCNCSMRHAYNPNSTTNTVEIPFCNVQEYFHCAQEVLKWGYDGGFSNFKCQAPCDEIDYTAWQDMNELPSNIFPRIIDFNDDDDENSEDDNINDDDDLDLDQELFKCEDNQLLEDIQVNRIKRQAHSAYEKQARFQEDILLRTKRLINRMRQTSNKLLEMKWGWHNDAFISVYQRLYLNVHCYANMSLRHSDVFNAISNPQTQGEEHRAQQLHQLLDKANYKVSPVRYKTISDVKRVYGDKAENKSKEMVKMEDILARLFNLYSSETYNHRLAKVLESRMDRVLLLMDQYAKGTLQRRAWAEKMQSRNMKHFFDEDFFESWYNVISKDLDSSIIKSISHIEDSLPLLQKKTVDGTELVTGSVLLFGDSEEQHIRLYANFMDEILNCTFNEVRNYSQGMLDEFKEAMHDFQSAYVNLFRKELPEYLENFEFGTKFVQENFAQVNVFLHKMNIEHWIQEPTYSIWSLMCDIGGALGLFLGASLLTLIEVAYFVFHTKIYKNLRFWKKDNKTHSRVRLNPKQKWSRVIEVSNGGSFKFPRRRRLPSDEQWRLSPSPTSSSAIFQSVQGDSNPLFSEQPSSSQSETPKQPRKTERDEFPPRRKFGSWDAEGLSSSWQKPDLHWQSSPATPKKSALRNKNTATLLPGQDKQKDDLNRQSRPTAVSPESQQQPSLDGETEKSSSSTSDHEKDANGKMEMVKESSTSSITSDSTNVANTPILFSNLPARKSTSSENEQKKKNNKKKLYEKQSVV